MSSTPQAAPTSWREGVVRPELVDLVAPACFLPERTDDVVRARELVRRDGAAVLTGGPAEPDALVRAAAALLGGRLRQVFPPRLQATTDAPRLGLHNDGANVVVDVHGRAVRLRDPDEDYLLQLSELPATTGGASVVVDGYALVDALAAGRPELHAFLTGVDVDFFGAWATNATGVPTTPRVCGMVEHTRTGRRVVRSSRAARPVPRALAADEHGAALEQWADVLATLESCAPGAVLGPGAPGLVDNYRCLHGRDGHTGPRRMHVLSVLSADAQGS